MKRNSFSKDSNGTTSNSAPSTLTSASGNIRAASTSILPLPSLTSTNGNSAQNKNGFAITFMHLGRKGYVITLWASTFVGRRKWLEAIAKQQEVLRERSLTFDTISLSEGFFIGQNKVNCAAPFSEFFSVVFMAS